MINIDKKRLLIVGGAGYIGAHIVLLAIDRGYKVTVFDDLSTGREENLFQDAEFKLGTTLSLSDLRKIFQENQYDGVIHLGASKAAGESMLDPIKYAENNLVGSLNLLKLCIENNVKRFVFSSSAAVYGNPKYVPIDELHSLEPSNYYGYTKLSIENNLKWFSELKKIRYAALRYFNASGYDMDNRVLGLESNPQNLIPIVMEAAMGTRNNVRIFGDSYDTKDGTGVRDYIHVTDLARAHVKSFEYLYEFDKDLILNLGSGYGHSVLDIIEKTCEISGNKIKYEYAPPRDGDPPITIAKVKLAKDLLNWEAKYSDLETIISTTWESYKLNHKL